MIESFVDANQGLFAHSSAVLKPGNSRVTREDTSAHNGMKTLVWQQELDGIPFFQTILRANLTRDGALITMGGNFLADPETAAEGGVVKRAALIANPPVSAAKAVALAAENIGTPLDESAVTTVGGGQGTERKQKLEAPSISDTSAGLAWVPMSEISAELAWDVTVMSTARGEMFRVLVDAENGEVLVRQSLTNYISPATFRVHARYSDKQPYDSPTPFSPGHDSPLAAQPAETLSELVTLDALNTTASPNGWIDDGGTETLGNNVDAHADSDAFPNVPDLPRPTSATRQFDFPVNFASPPSAYKDAAVTNLFYLNNWVHDKLYELGFTESAGNFQSNNFGRGGFGSDAVQADAQDGSGTNNANFSTPSDGSPGRMQMYVFTGPTPDIDGDLDSEIVIHEYVHGLSNRLVGGGAGISASQTQGMGEGWSDFYALSLLSESGDTPNGCYAAGAYATRSYSGLGTNYYYGIRRYPYSTELSKNPLTFKDIDPAQASLHAGVPRSPIIGNVANEVHNVGEVWCATLWDLRANLIEKHGYGIGNPLALQLVTDAMKLSPLNPNFLQSRDAIIQADLVNNAGDNMSELWAAFAKRGMGAGATSPASTTTTGLTEAYDVPDNLGVTPLGTFTANGQTSGAISPASQVFTLHNSGGSPLNWTAAKTQPWLTLSNAGGTLAAGASTTVTASFNAAASSLIPGNYSDTITFTNSATAAALPRNVSLTIEPYFLPIFWEPFESGGLASAWTITGTGNHRTVVTTANSPHAGNYHLTMDSGVDGNYSRNEATLTLNLASRSNVTLSFWVKMFNDEPHAPPSNPFANGADFDGVAVSADGGTTWHEIRDLRSISNSWQKISLNLDAAVVARGLAYTSNFKIRFNHYDNYSISTDGFAFDDILVAESFNSSLTLAAPGSATEGDAPVTATITANPVPAADLVVALLSNSTDATVPASVTIPAGSASVNFQITPVNDNLLDGSQVATITASAATFPDASKPFTVHDNETAVIGLDIPNSATEGSSPLTGLIMLNAPPDKDVVVTLASDNPSVQVPHTVTLPAGSTSTTFSLLPVNDNRINGDRAVGISASVVGWTPANSSMTILDDETSLITLTLPTLREGDSGKSGAVTISGTLASDLTISLGCDDLSELTVPATVTIAAGQTQAAIPLTVIDDGETDGAQPVTMTATAAGFPASSVSGSVADNDAHHFELTPVPPTVLRNSPLGLSVTAMDVNDVIITNYTGAVTFGALDESTTDVPLTSSPPDVFQNGVLATNVTFSAYANGVTLHADDGSGHAGYSDLFDVVSGPLDHFSWSPVASPQHVDAPFQATLQALDSAENPVESFTGPAALSAILSAKVEVLTWTAYADTSVSGEYAQTKQAISSYFTNYNETTTTTSDPTALAAALVGKNVFLIVEQENANSTTLGALGTAWAPVLNAFVGNGGTVIACSNTTSEHLVLTNSGLVNLTPLSSPTTASLTKTADTPLNAGVTVPFTGSYLHTYSTTNGTADLLTATNEPVVISRNIGAGRAVMIGTDYYTLGTGMDRIVANAVAQAQPAAFNNLPLSPATALPFVNGTWTGAVIVPFTAPAVRIRATVGAETCDSNSFAVQSVAPPSNRTTLFVETFESGSLNPAYWVSTGTGNFRTQVTSSYSPHAGSRHMTMDSTANLARNEATLALDLTGKTGVMLEFWAVGFNDEPNGPPPAPFIGGADFDGVAISADGTTWWEVQGLRSLPGTYGKFTVDLDAAIAAHGLTYNPAFKIRFNQYDDFPLTTDGIAIDDITVTAAAPPSGIVLTVPTEAVEGSGILSGTVSLAASPPVDLTINLASTAAGKVTVQPAVTIHAGQNSAPFNLTVLDEAFIDGDKIVGITADAAGYTEAFTSIRVVDNDGGTITLSLPASTSENSGSVTGSLTLSIPALTSLTFELTSNSPLVAQPQPTITLPRGATTAMFQVAIPDDAIVDGDQTAHIVASLEAWTSGESNLLVEDDENRDLTLSIPTSYRESDPPKTGTVSLSGLAASDVVIALQSDRVSEITVPAAVTIPAGQNSATFALTVQDDPVADGPQPFSIIASAGTFSDALASGTVRDNEAHHFTFTAIGSSQLKNAPVPAIITARDSSDAVITDYDSAVSLSASGDSGSLTTTPAVAGRFINGVWNGSVQIDALGTNVVILAEDGLGHAGSSNPFNLVAGQIHHFAWDTIPSPQTMDTPFSATVRAVDENGGTVGGYNGIANLFVLADGPNSPVGTGSIPLSQPISSYAHDSRCTVLYKANEIGGTSRITALALDLASVPTVGETLNNWTIRIKHSTLANLNYGAPWDNTGWITVYQASPVVTSTGWMTFVFSTPFDFNGTANLLVDFSMDRTASAGSGVQVRGTGTDGVSVLSAVSNSGYGNPLTWSGTTPFANGSSDRPNVIFSSVKEIPIRPSQSESFSNGVWSGEISVPVSGNGLKLRAKAGSLSGTSNAFDANGPTAPPSDMETVFSEPFESDTLDPAFWTSTGTGNFRTQVTSAYSPHAGFSHLAMDSTSAAARNEATVTLDLTDRTGVVLNFWAAGFSDEPNGPPPAPFTGGADFDGVAISADGNTWWEVQGLRSLPSTYGEFTVDLDAAIAAHGLTYNSAFKIRFNQYDDFPLTTDGIVIDDITVSASPATGFAFNTPLQVTEGAGAVTASVTLNEVAAFDTVISLASSAPAKISIPPSVTVPAGATSADFVLNVADDTITDGDRTVAITGVITDKAPRAANVVVIDDETLPIDLIAPATVAEGSTGQSATVSLPVAPSGMVTVHLSSSDPGEFTVPASITFQPGQTHASFPITVINDSEIDGTQSVTLTASVDSWTDASATILVTDNENHFLTLSGPYPGYEGTTTTGTVQISGTLPTALTVTLASSDPTQFAVPASVVIPAGSTGVSFTATPVDDTATDGTRNVTITALAAGFQNATADSAAYDNDVHHFSISPIPATIIRGAPVGVTISARDVDDSTIAVFSGTAGLATIAGGNPVAMTPVVTGSFSSGSWTGNLTFNTQAGGAILTASDSSGHTGASNSFNIGVGAATALNWDPVPSFIETNSPISATLRASDDYGNPVTSFNGSASVSLGASQRTTGTGTNTSSQPLYTLAQESRCQTIYTAAELGGTGKLPGLALDVAQVPGLSLTRFTIRIRPTSLSTYASPISWENSGWTTVFQSNVAITHTGWLFLPFSVPYQYNGSGNLMVDFSFDNAASGTGGLVRGSSSGSTRTYYFYSYGTNGDPLNWSGTSPAGYTSATVPNLRLRVERALAVSPSTVVLENGMWSGSISTTAAGSGLTLTADAAGGLTGESNVFTSVPSAIMTVTPTSPLSASGPYLGPFAPGGKTYTLTNSGDAPLFWTADKSSAWLGISNTNGTLAPGASITVEATVAANTLHPGTYYDTIAFTNTTNGRGNTNSNVSLDVVLPAPVIAPEPDFSANSENTITWLPVNGAASYEIQCSGDVDFTSPQSSGWINGSSHTFTNLQDDAAVFYRVRCRLIPTTIESGWSSTVTSTQDASPPEIIRNTPLVTDDPILVAQGGTFDVTSGVSAVSVNGRAVISTDDLATWNTLPMLLVPGDNVISITAADNVNPANSTAENWLVTYTGPATTDADGDGLPDVWESTHGLNPADGGGTDPLQGSAGDPDRDGISNLLEYALDLNPAAADPSGLPTTALLIKPADGLKYLTFHYRRRIERDGLQYIVETSLGLGNPAWDSSGTDVEEISATPNGDGITEDCIVRILPSAGSTPHKFVRLRVLAD
ncbi:MAG: M36 family metallopeptidase [Luteolibacter sp.]